MIVFILILALGLRLISLNQSLWLDESINVLAAKNLPFWQFVTGYPLGDFHPPGYFGLLWIWERLFGVSEIAVRIPSVILGVVTIYVLFLIGQKIFNQKIAIWSALFLAVSPLSIYYSQEARMYALAAFAVTLNFWLFLQLLEKSKKYFFWYVFSVVLVLLSDYVAYLALPVQLVFVVIYYHKKIKELVLAWVTSGFIFSPWLLIFPQQLKSGEITAQNVPGWAKIVGGSSLKNFALIYIKAIIGRVTITNKTVYGLVLFPIGLFYLWILSFLRRKMSQENMLIFLWVFLPSLISLLVSLFVPALSYFRLLFVVPPLCLLVASAISNISHRLQILAVSVVISISLICLFFYYTQPEFQRENWRGLENYFETSTNQSLILFEDNNIPAPFSYYLQQNRKPQNFYQGGLKNFPASKTIDVKDFSDLNKYNQIYLVDYLVQISDPNRTIDQKLTQEGFHVTKAIDFPSLGLIYEYTKNQ